jgi:hypothetical protein
MNHVFTKKRAWSGEGIKGLDDFIISVGSSDMYYVFRNSLI